METTRIQLRRGTAAEWSAANPVLADGEPGLEKDTKVFKWGDGVTAWNDLAPFGAGGSPSGGGGGGGPLGAKRAIVSGWDRSTPGQVVSTGYTFSNMPGNPPGTPPTLLNGGYAFDVPAAEGGWYSMRISLAMQFTGGTPEKVVFYTNTYYNNRQITQDIILSNGDPLGGLQSNQTGWGAAAEIFVPAFANPGFDPSDGSYYMGSVKLEWLGAGDIGSSMDEDPHCWIDVVRLG